MVVDNCPAHPLVNNLKAIKLVFCPQTLRPRLHQQLQEKLQEGCCGVVPVDGTLGAFLYIDEDVPTAEETSIQQIAADLREDKSDSEEDEEETTPTSVVEARSALLSLRKFVIEQGIDDMRSSFFSFEFSFEDHIVRRARQTVITDHFKNKAVS
ncbi:hypothetical protein PoB_006450200 [Plakobranchus ocellatus]|uniref:DDE-1 domain-containing protein n=1 Tax=Plakobranchus ocellatus TaxID=259542 RepID=A0AAV4D1G0_9GAST|nr:hypothetical protein PoB_006450200 [Plakobranchus ocellatus]